LPRLRFVTVHGEAWARGVAIVSPVKATTTQIADKKTHRGRSLATDTGRCLHLPSTLLRH
jgi:hypothetical protein